MTAQLVYATVISLISVFFFYYEGNIENKVDKEALEPGRRTSVVEPLALPLSILVLTILQLFLHDWTLPLSYLSNGLIFFIHISLYYMLLIILLPFLRKVISARACASLWIVPSVMYYFYLHGNLFGRTGLVFITVSKEQLKLILLLWFAGFILVFLYSLMRHLLYRKVLTEHSTVLNDEDLLSLWKEESVKHGVKKAIPILISEKVTTPLTIGCFERSMLLVLPNRTYTKEEIELIFRHELVHIMRSDAQSKLLLDLFVALSWFNPLGWLAKKKTAEDFELSVDEKILAAATKKERTLYANLLLKSAGKTPGYTTQLSAAASSLRYRLKNIVEPKKRLSGGIVVGLAIFFLILSIGTISIADSPKTAEELIFEKMPEKFRVLFISTDLLEEGNLRDVYAWKEKELTAYLKGLHLRKIYSGKRNIESSPTLYIHYDLPSEKLGSKRELVSFELRNDSLYAHLLISGEREQYFLVDEKIDWNYLKSLLDFDAENPHPEPSAPELKLIFPELQDEEKTFTASKRILSLNGKERKQEMMEQINFLAGTKIKGKNLTKAILQFSYFPEDDYEIMVENWDKAKSYTITSKELKNHVLPLADYSAHYSIWGRFKFRDTVYDMVFTFDVEVENQVKN